LEQFPDRRVLIEPSNKNIPVRRQCELLDVPRSTFYYKPGGEDQKNLELMKFIDKTYTAHPFLGSPKITELARRQFNEPINHKRIERLMSLMGLQAIYPKRNKNTGKGGEAHKKYPYLLKDLAVIRPNQVWGTDITYIQLGNGFCYLIALIDWFSRYVIAWELSGSLENWFCIEALERALAIDFPEIHNSDQGCQFTSKDYTAILESRNIRISMDGRGRCFDNIFTERLWRTVKYEDVYLKRYLTISEAHSGLNEYFPFYNNERPHQSLDYHTPAEVYFQSVNNN